MSRKPKARRKERQKFTDAQLQAFRARQESALPRSEIERRREEERERERALGRAKEEVPQLTAEQIAREYEGVRQELYRIAIWGGFTLLLLMAIAVYMNAA
jgi:hypothetical protein